jgi:hypothetical protein
MYLEPSPSSSFIHFLSSGNFAFHYVDTLQPIEFPILIELNSSLNIVMLFFAFILRIFRVKIAAELFDTLLDIKNWG